MLIHAEAIAPAFLRRAGRDDIRVNLAAVPPAGIAVACSTGAAPDTDCIGRLDLHGYRL
jgi:hypothetical protein